MKQMLWILLMAIGLLPGVSEASSGPMGSATRFWLALAVLPAFCAIELIVLLVWRAFLAAFLTVLFLGLLLFALASLGGSMVAFFLWPWIAFFCTSGVLFSHWRKRKQKRATANNLREFKAENK